MPELTILEGQGAGLRVPLTAEQAYSIGGGRDDSIQVPGLADGYLIVKALKSGGFGIKGLGGPFRHNGAPVEVARLGDGDRLEVGSVILEYRERAAAAEPEPIPIKPSKSKKRSEAGASKDRAPKPGSEIGGFRILDVLGRGGMGVVFRAEQVSLSREVALKVLSDKLTADPVFVERFVDEARAAARLHHPNVVQVFDVDQVDGTSFYSMELMHKGSVEDELKRSGRLAVPHALRVITDAARGLGFAESLRIVHRDIKPDNLMVDQHDHVKIADLGLAMTDDEAGGGRVLGTPHFMSPEQIQRQPLDHRSDLYALGCTFFRLVTGETPFKGANVKEIVRAHVKTPAPLAHEVAPDVPSDVSTVIARLLEKDPDARFQSADELLQALGELEAPPSRKGLLVGGLAAAALIAGGAVWWAASRPDPETKTITVKVKDQNAIDAAAKSDAVAAESSAQAAYYEVQARGLDGLAKADALAIVARDHADTEFGNKAKGEAEGLREAAKKAQQALEARRANIATASASVRGAFDKALSAGNFSAADSSLSMEAVPAELRESPEIKELHDTLLAQLSSTAKTKLQGLKAAIDDAVNARDASRIEVAVAALQATLSGPTAWPASALDDRGPVERFVADAKVTIDSIRAESRTAIEVASWESTRDLMIGSAELASLLRRLDFTAAAQRADSFAEAAGSTGAAAHIRALGAACTAASRYLAAYSQAAEAGALSFTEGEEELRSVRFDRGANPGLVVKTGGRRPVESVRPLADMLRQPLLYFPQLQPNKLSDDRTALLATLLLAEQIDRAQRYLSTVVATSDSSGVGSYEGAPPALFAKEFTAALSRGSESWRDPLRAEIEAVRSIDRALRAFSEQRNLDAARLLEHALKAGNKTSIVQCLL